MRQRTRGILLVGFLFAVSAAPAVSQTCLPYEPDPRKEAYDAVVDADLTQADALIVRSSAFLLPSLEPGTFRMEVKPWTEFQVPPPATPPQACSDRDYHGQPTPGSLGSGVLVGPRRVLTVGHIFQADECADLKVVFGYGKFSPQQWQITCDTQVCWVTIPAQDVYSCVDEIDNQSEDWAVVRLDRTVNRTPLPILREPPFPLEATPVIIIGHPNRIPMKVEHVQVNTEPWCPYCIEGHVIKGHSGSMVVDEGTRKVIGIVVGPQGPIQPGCPPPNDPNVCYREWFLDPPPLVEVTPAWLAGGSIPEL